MFFFIYVSFCYTVTQTRNEFSLLAELDPTRHAELRRRAKAINFGIPGGEGVDTLRDYVASQYGIVMSRDEAEAYRCAKCFVIYICIYIYI